MAPREGFVATHNGKAFLIRIPFGFGSDIGPPRGFDFTPLIDRNRFVEVMAPLAGAILQYEFEQRFPPPAVEKEDSLAKALSEITRVTHRIHFESEHKLGSSETTLSQGHFHYSFKVEWRRSAVIDELMSAPSIRQGLLSFARDYLQMIDRSCIVKSDSGDDYLKLELGRPFEKRFRQALATLALIADGLENNQLAAADRDFWSEKLRHAVVRQQPQKRQGWLFRKGPG